MCTKSIFFKTCDTDFTIKLVTYDSKSCAGHIVLFDTELQSNKSMTFVFSLYNTEFLYMHLDGHTAFHIRTYTYIRM